MWLEDGDRGYLCFFSDSSTSRVLLLLRTRGDVAGGHGERVETSSTIRRVVLVRSIVRRGLEVVERRVGGHAVLGRRRDRLRGDGSRGRGSKRRELIGRHCGEVGCAAGGRVATFRRHGLLATDLALARVFLGCLRRRGRQLVRAFMLLHVVLAREGLVADGTQDTLLTRVLLAVTSSVTRRGEGRVAVVRLRVRTRVFILLARRRRRLRDGLGHIHDRWRRDLLMMLLWWWWL